MVGSPPTAVASAPSGDLPPEGGGEDLPVIRTLAELRTYLHQEHGVSVGSDDPVLMMFTIHRVFIADYERMLSVHNKALTQTISAAIAGLTKDALVEHFANQVRLADRTQKEFDKQFRRARLMTVVNAVAAVVCVPVLVYVLVF